ncbi:hypothetical protein SPRG_16788 [Saprolegnia parasitica CBS 223.65]|uniref:Uncharacterized protein n=1 Tax=Saprolegnia parasitica (strain CBS 223.65) TaxID=695850 RepID=A0A067BTE7_SAPPC|nr:hypothetical protein SPRG_16788 [Saprolegnia parasitica CBS 223.65]KDO17556.1 hypothetical protein SPRG_16788 [Saprolegnia parasitica CBS 223.65]|eukprot:XP_012211740.1 hypothetical protein SPRG_16788 [Saprolegnia parasitica CBS 223.65]
MLMQAEILAYQSKFQLAAKVLMDADEAGRAIQMFSDLRMWDEAKKFAAQSKAIDVKQLVLDQAKWAEDVHDWRAASEMYLASGNLLKAVQIMGARGWHNDLVEVVQRPDADSQVLALCADYLYKAGKFKQCRDVYVKIGNFDALLKMHIDCHEWEEAVRLAQKHKDKVKNLADVYVPYAEWLATQDRFEDALGAYTLAKRPEKCMALLDELIASAVAETRFKDASYYHWRICDEMLGSIKASSPENVTADDQKTLASALSHEVDGKIYYAYSLIFAYTDEPFTTLQPETLFHASRFLSTSWGRRRRHRASPSRALRSLWRSTRSSSRRSNWRASCTSGSRRCAMVIQTKPYSDRDDLLPIDYRSSTTNPLLHPTSGGDVCVNSAHPFVRSFLSFDNLPLVEFAPTPDLSDDEAMALIDTLPPIQQGDINNNDKWKTSEHGGAQSMQLNDHTDDEPQMGNLFERALNKQGGHGRGAPYRVLVVDAKVLLSLRPNEVFVVKYPTKALRYKYYKNMIPDIKVHLSPSCRMFFHEDDFEFEHLRQGCCPYCRVDEYSEHA